MIAAETCVAQTYPVYDHRFRSDPKNPFKLYDCMKPQLHCYVEKPIQLIPETHAYDIKLAIEMKHLEDKAKENRILIAQQNIQDEEIKQLRDEL